MGLGDINAPVRVASGTIDPNTGIWTAAGGSGDASAANQVVLNSLLTTVFSTANSSSTPLAANGVFTGASEDITKYAEIRVTVISDQASATNGLQIQQSPDGVNWDNTDLYTIPAASGKTFGTGAVEKFFRVVYTNGATLQTSFRLQVKLNVTITKPSSQRPQDGRPNDNDFEEVLSYLMVFNGTSWDRSPGTIANGLLVNVSALIPGVAAGSLGKAEDAASVTGDTGVFSLGVRADTLVATTNANGDYSQQSVDKYGALITKPEATHKRTYSASFTATPAAAATDIATITGSASTTVSVTKIIISGSQTTGGMVPVAFVKRTAVNTGGTSAAVTPAKHVTADAAPTAVVNNFSANPTGLGAGVQLRKQNVPFAALTAVTNNITTFDFGASGEPIVLAGVAEALAINLAAATITGGSVNIDIEFTEE